MKKASKQRIDYVHSGVIVRSQRKTLAICIKPDGTLEIRAPLNLSAAAVEQFVASKSNWIELKRAQIAERQLAAPRETPLPLFSPGELECAACELIKLWEMRLGVAASFVGWRAMTSRWGSCTPRTRRIRLNTALEYCPRECLEYVIVHELAHLREANHSMRFWAAVAEALPDYKARQAKLSDLQWILRRPISSQ
ncbi:MAG: M48 family metallopeptidase [Oscillospiraceae bacterium]|jgi:predicted metal-dependent hydrolase|nr:M48 family metallopeptidase [Oscillospiraceae bacterium]